MIISKGNKRIKVPDPLFEIICVEKTWQICLLEEFPENEYSFVDDELVNDELIKVEIIKYNTNNTVKVYEWKNYESYNLIAEEVAKFLKENDPTGWENKLYKY